MNKAIAIIPTFNEAENIGSLLLKISRDVPQVDVLVVDDSSPDGTGKIVQRFSDHDTRVNLLKRDKKGGLAGAYLAGFDWALSKDYQFILQMDADFSHHPDFLHPMLQALDHCDLAIGCRYMKGGGVSGWGILRQFISRGGNFYAKTALNLPFQDLTGGFTAWRRKALQKINYRATRSKGYSFQVELKYRAHKFGLRVKEVPIHFENRKYGDSKMSGNIFLEAAFRVMQLRFSNQ